MESEGLLTWRVRRSRDDKPEDDERGEPRDAGMAGRKMVNMASQDIWGWQAGRLEVDELTCGSTF